MGGNAVKIDLIKYILLANVKNLPLHALSLAFNLTRIGSQNKLLLGLPPTSRPIYLKGALI